MIIRREASRQCPGFYLPPKKHQEPVNPSARDVRTPPGEPAAALGSSSTERLRADIAEAACRSSEPGVPRDERLSWRARLAVLLRDLAVHEADGAHLELALSVYRANLEETSPDDGDARWRETNGHMGAAMLELHRLTGDPDHAANAVRPFRNSLALHTPGTSQHRHLSRCIGEALLVGGRHRGDVEMVRQSVAAYRASVAEQAAPGVEPTDEHAESLRELAVALRTLGVLASEVDALDEARRHLESALEMARDDEPFTRLLLVAEARRVAEALARHAPRSVAVLDALLADSSDQRRRF